MSRQFEIDLRNTMVPGSTTSLVSLTNEVMAMLRVRYSHLVSSIELVENSPRSKKFGIVKVVLMPNDSTAAIETQMRNIAQNIISYRNLASERTKIKRAMRA